MMPWIIMLVNFYFRIKLNEKKGKFQLFSTLAKGRDPRLQIISERTLTSNSPSDKSMTQINHIPSQNYRASTKRLATQHLPSKWLYLLASQKFGERFQILIFVCVAIGIGIDGYLTDFPISPCGQVALQFKAIIGVWVSAAIFVLFMIYKVRNEPDPLKIKKDVILAFSLGAVFGLVNAILYIEDPGDLEREGGMRSTHFWVVYSTISIFLALGNPVIHSFREARERTKQADNELENVLSSGAGRTFFKAFLISEFSVENYLFWNDATNYKEHYEMRDQDTNELMRGNIIKYYISSEGQLSINLPYGLRTAILANEEMKRDEFDDALNEIFGMMELDSLPRFKKTDEYKSILWEMNEA